MTRRFFGLCLALLMALLLCTACNSQNKNPEKPVTTGFACDVDMTYQDMRVKGHLTRMSAGTLKMEFTEPATLNGMSMEWDGETISVKYAGLSFGVDPAAVPESALGKGLLDALDAGFRSGGEGQMTDKGLSVTGQSVNGQFEMLSDPQTGQLLSLKIPVDKIRDVIGSGGKVVRGIQDETGAQIDIQEDGTIHIAAIEGPAGEAAKAMILGIVKEPEVGEIFEGEVVGIKDFGAFVKLTPGKDGLLHISRVANGRVGSVEDVLQLGDTVKVQVLEIDPKTGKISLDRLDKPDAPEGSAPAPREHRGRDRHEGGKREGGQRDVRPGRANRTPRRRHESQ